VLVTNPEQYLGKSKEEETTTQHQLQN
jgi:hypothetical protein